MCVWLVINGVWQSFKPDVSCDPAKLALSLLPGKLRIHSEQQKQHWTRVLKNPKWILWKWTYRWLNASSCICFKIIYITFSSFSPFFWTWVPDKQSHTWCLCITETRALVCDGLKTKQPHSLIFSLLKDGIYIIYLSLSDCSSGDGHAASSGFLRHSVWGESQRLPCWRGCMEVLCSVVSAELPASTPGLADSHANCHFGCLDHLYFQMTTAWYLTTRAWETPVRTTQPSPSQILHQKCMSNIKWLLFYKAKFYSHLHSAVETRSPPSFSLIQGSHK